MQRQLQFNLFDRFDWASNATQLGSLYIEHGSFYLALMCFLVSSDMIDGKFGIGTGDEQRFRKRKWMNREHRIQRLRILHSEMERQKGLGSDVSEFEDEIQKLRSSVADEEDG